MGLSCFGGFGSITRLASNLPRCEKVIWILMTGRLPGYSLKVQGNGKFVKAQPSRKKTAGKLLGITCVRV